jgi:hypothetical protein
VILTTGRSASNLLVAALQDHPSILAYSELFIPGEEVRKSIGRCEGGEYYAEGQDAAEFLSSAVYDRPYSPATHAVGFKLLFDQARGNERERNAWRFLIDRRDIRVLHVVRPNLLDALVSYEVARRTGEWFREIGRSPEGPPFETLTLSPLYCSWFFRRATIFNRWVVRTFVGRPMLTLTFHELTGLFDSTMQRVYRFLDVAPVAVKPRYVKQSVRTPELLVENYEELKQRFESTQFGWFF